MRTGMNWLAHRRILLLAAGVLAMAGCAAPSPPIQVPAELPNTTKEDLLTLRWALVREGTTARAVGVADSTDGAAFQARLFFYGVDGQGRVVTQAVTDVQSGFGPFPPPTPFEVDLVTKGGEVRFELQVHRMFGRLGR